MYNVSDAYRKAIKDPGRIFKSKFTLLNTNKVIDDNNIVTFTYNDDIIAKDDFEVGTAIMSTLTCELLYSTELEGIVFENKEINLEIGIELEDKSFEYVPIGLYTIESPEFNSSKLTFKGVDRMYKFEKDYVTSLIYPTTLLKIAQEICQLAGVELVNTSFPNSDYTINYQPVLENITLRKAIAQVAELAGGYARITRDGKLEIFNVVTGFNMAKYANNIDFYTEDRPVLLSDEGSYRQQGFVRSVQLTKDNYINLTSKELALAQINKIIVKLGTEEASMGDGNNPYYVVDNMFCQDPNKVVENLYNVLNGLSYLPLQSKWQGDPSLDCGDLVDLYITDDKFTTSIFTSRTVTYKGGLREEVQAVGKSDTERKSTSKGSMTLDMKKALTRIEVMDGKIAQRVTQEDFESYVEQTAEKISSKVSNNTFESYVEQTADELTSKVSRGEDLETEVKQNAESWELSIKGKLNGTKYKFDGNSFTIGGTSGDNATHTPSMSKYIHSDGSYTQISSAGLERFVSGQAKKYHYLLYSNEVEVNRDTVEIQLPDDFKGKNFYVSFFIKQISGGVTLDNQSALQNFGVAFYNDASSIDYINAKVRVYAFATFTQNLTSFKYGSVKLGYIVTA